MRLPSQTAMVNRHFDPLLLQNYEMSVIMPVVLFIKTSGCVVAHLLLYLISYAIYCVTIQEFLKIC